MLMPDIQCSKYADMLNDDRTLFQNPSCAIWQSLFGSQVSLEPSSTISPLSTKEFEGHLFIKLLPPLSHIDLPTVPVCHTKSIGAQAYDRYPKWDRTSLVTGWCCGPWWEHWEHRLMILFQKLDFCLQFLNHLLFEFSETKQEAEL